MDCFNIFQIRESGPISGSGKNAAVALGLVREISNRLGFGFSQYHQAFSNLQAAAGTTLEGDNTRKILTAVSNRMTALGNLSDGVCCPAGRLDTMVCVVLIRLLELEAW